MICLFSLDIWIRIRDSYLGLWMLHPSFWARYKSAFHTSMGGVMQKCLLYHHLIVDHASYISREGVRYSTWSSLGPVRKTETHLYCPKVASWRSKRWTWPMKKRYYQPFTCKWLKPRMVLLTPSLNFLHWNTVYYSVRGFAQQGRHYNCDLNSVLAEKGVVASGKSHSCKSFAFSCFRTPVTGMSFSRCYRKHDNVQAFR